MFFRQKKALVSGHRSASKSVCRRVFFFFFFFFFFFPSFFLPAWKYVLHCIRGDQISHIQSMVAKRGLTNQANVHTPMWKSNFKAQHGRTPIDPAILATIGHRFIATTKRKLKMATRVDLRQRTRRPETRDFSLALCFYKFMFSLRWKHCR